MYGAMVIYGLFAAIMILIFVIVMTAAAVSALRNWLRRGTAAKPPEASSGGDRQG